VPRSPASPGIFISYRRADSSGFAGRLYDRLSQRFGAGRVFMDIDTIHPGHEFAADIERALSECVACIVLIGRDWESIALPDGRRRLEDPTDFVRLEIAAAIRRGVAVFPVLVDGATPPPAASLPEEIRDVAGRQAIELSNERWNYDVGRLLLALDEVVGQRRHRLWPRPGPRKLPAILVGAAILLSVLGIGGWLATRGTSAAGGTSPTGETPTGGASPTGSPSGAVQLGKCGPLASPPSSGAALSGTYSVSVNLTCRHGSPGDANRLWGELNPAVDVPLRSWESQPWKFVQTESGLFWKYQERNVFAPLSLNGEGTYTATSRGSVPNGCSILPEKTHRELSLNVSPNSTKIEGWLVIWWTCDGLFVARFDVSGSKGG
jgi:hypothetical protein